MDRLQFMGSTLFIPIFLVSVGILLEPKVMVDPKTLGIALIFTVAVLGGKALAAVIAGRTFRFTWPEVGVMSGLSGSQAAATLATTLVGAKLGLFDKQTINAVLVVILASLVVTPALVSLFGKRVTAVTEEAAALGKTVLVPVWGDSTRPVLALAGKLATSDGGIVLAASFARTESSPAEQAAQRGLTTEAEGWLAKEGLESRTLFRVAETVPEGLLETILGEKATLLINEWHARDRLQPDSEQSAALARSPVPTLIAHGDVAHFDRVLIVTHPGQPGAPWTPEPGAGGGAGASIRPRLSDPDGQRHLRSGAGALRRHERDGLDRGARSHRLDQAQPAEGRSAVLRGARRLSAKRSSASRRWSTGAFWSRWRRTRRRPFTSARSGWRARSSPGEASSLTPLDEFRQPHPKFVATFATRFTHACNCHVPDGEEDSAGRSSVPPARGGPAGAGPDAGGRRLRDRSRDRPLRVRRPAARRAVPGDGPRVAGRGRRGRQRGQEPQARRSGGHDGAPPLRQPRVPPLPPQPAGLLRHRRLHRARHHAPARLHDRRGGRSGGQHARGAPGDRRHRGPHGAAHHRRKGAHRARLRAGPHALGQPGQGGEAGVERRGARRGAGRPPRRAGAAGAGVRHLDLLARERHQPARRLGREDRGPLHRVRASFRSAISPSRSGTSISSTRRPARRRWPSPPCRRSARTASSSSPASPATRPPSPWTPSRSCGTWCWRISSSTGRSTLDRRRSRRRSAIWGSSTQRWPGPVRELITGHFAPEQITDILSPGHGGIKNVIRFGTPIGVAAGAKSAAATAKGGARG